MVSARGCQAIPRRKPTHVRLVCLELHDEKKERSRRAISLFHIDKIEINRYFEQVVKTTLFGLRKGSDWKKKIIIKRGACNSTTLARNETDNCARTLLQFALSLCKTGNAHYKLKKKKERNTQHNKATEILVTHSHNKF